MTRRTNGIRPGVPVAVAAFALYAGIVSSMPPGSLQIIVAVLTPLAGMAATIGIAVRRLARPGSDRESTIRTFETAGALLMAAPVVGLGVWLSPEGSWIPMRSTSHDNELAQQAGTAYSGRHDKTHGKGPQE